MIISVLVFLLIFITILKIKNKKSEKSLIKTKNLYYLAKPKKNIFTTRQMLLNFFNSQNFKQFKSLKELKCVDHILSCVLYNSPKTYGKEVDLKVLENAGINCNLPIFFVENIDEVMFKHLICAKNYADFNIIFLNNSYLNKNKDKKLKNKIKYFVIDEKYCSLKLLNNIMLLNINAKDKFKVKKIVLDNFFEIKNSGLKLNTISKIDNNFYCDCYYNNNVDIEVQSFVYNGKFKKFIINNKTSVNQKIKIKIQKKLDNKYYSYQKKNGLMIYDVLKKTKFFVQSDDYIKIQYPENENNIIEHPYFMITKQIVLKPYQKTDFLLYFGNCFLTKTQINSCVCNYLNRIKNIVNFSVKIDDKKLEYLFNEFLPKKIILEDKKESCSINEKSYNVVYDLLKEKKINYYQFYMWLKEKYFGFIENENFIKINPLCEQSFDINYKLKEDIITIKVLIKKSCYSYVQIGNVKYYNYTIIPKNKIDKFTNLVLVI